MRYEGRGHTSQLILLICNPSREFYQIRLHNKFGWASSIIFWVTGSTDGHPLNIQPVDVVSGLKRQQAAASTNLVGYFLLALSYFFYFSPSSVSTEWPYWSQRWAFGPNNIFHSIPFHRQTHRHRRHAKNDFFGLSNPQNVEIHQNLEVSFLDQCNTFSIKKVKKDWLTLAKLFMDTLQNTAHHWCLFMLIPAVTPQMHLKHWGKSKHSKNFSICQNMCLFLQDWVIPGKYQHSSQMSYMSSLMPCIKGHTLRIYDLHLQKMTELCSKMKIHWWYQRNIDMATFPPCCKSLEHTRWVNYQARIWKQAYVAKPSIPAATDRNGWATINEKLEPLWFDVDVLPQKPVDISEEPFDSLSDDDESDTDDLTHVLADIHHSL